MRNLRWFQSKSLPNQKPESAFGRQESEHESIQRDLTITQRGGFVAQPKSRRSVLMFGSFEVSEQRNNCVANCQHF